jgi:hypothetical protein
MGPEWRSFVTIVPPLSYCKRNDRIVSERLTGSRRRQELSSERAFGQRAFGSGRSRRPAFSAAALSPCLVSRAVLVIPARQTCCISPGHGRRPRPDASAQDCADKGLLRSVRASESVEAILHPDFDASAPSGCSRVGSSGRPYHAVLQPTVAVKLRLSPKFSRLDLNAPSAKIECRPPRL